MLFTEFNMDDALDVRYEEGVEAGKRTGIAALISSCKEFGLDYTTASEQVKKKFLLDDTAAEQYMNLYW